MKAAAFDYARPATAAAARQLLAAAGGMAKLVAGGQSLGPMLNLRLAQPASLVDLTALDAFASVRDDGAALFIGAGVTHAAIEDALSRQACVRAARRQGRVKPCDRAASDD